MEDGYFSVQESCLSLKKGLWKLAYRSTNFGIIYLKAVYNSRHRNSTGKHTKCYLKVSTNKIKQNLSAKNHFNKKTFLRSKRGYFQELSTCKRKQLLNIYTLISLKGFSGFLTDVFVSKKLLYKLSTRKMVDKQPLFGSQLR